MLPTRLFRLLMITAFLVLTACSPQASAQDEPVTLRLAVADDEGRPSDPYVREFISQVNLLSNGNITIEPIWNAGDTIETGFERGVIQLLKDGKYDLGLAGSRAFDTENITSFQALQAPFLIDNDALSKAVATSDIATQMLDNMKSAGVVGLTLWPEDLRHPFSLVPGETILSVEDLKGKNVRTTPSEISYKLIETLGGIPMFGDNEFQAAESGLRQGASLTGTPTATGNVVFFPKFQVLFANGPAFEKLSEAQRNILLEAAIVTQKKAIAEHPSDVDAGTAWCADGGSIVVASNEQVAAFQTAAQPVFDKLQQDSFNAESIVALKELKTNTQPSVGAQACAPTTSIPTQVSAENQVWSQGLPPNGVWRVELSIDDFVRMGVLISKAKDWAGAYEYEFGDGKGVHRGSGDWGNQTCPFTAEVVEDFVRVTFIDGPATNDCSDDVDEIQWRLDADGLHLHLVGGNAGVTNELKAMYESKPWQKVDEWSQGLPPNGKWTVNLAIEDVVAKGVPQSKATGWAGLIFYEFQDGQGKFRAEYLDGGILECAFTYEAVDDFFRLIYSMGYPDCSGEIDDLQWRLDAEGQLYFHVIDIKGAPLLENTAIYEARPWQNSILNGTWDYIVSDEETRQFFMSNYGVTADEVRVRFGFNDNQWYEVAIFDGKPFFVNGLPEGDLGTFRIEGDRLIQIGNHGQTQVTYTWVLNGDQLTLTVVEECDITPTGLNCRDDKSQMDPIMIMVTEHTYTKSGDDGSY